MSFKEFLKEFKMLKAFYISGLSMSIGGGLTGVLFAIYFLLLGFSPVQLSLFVVAIMISSMVFEIPTGSFADYFGRKLSVIVSNIGGGIVFMLVPMFDSFLPLFALWLLSGMFFTFRSGAEEAWFVDFIKHNKKSKILQKALARFYSIGLVGMVVGGIVSSTLMISMVSQNFSSISAMKWLWTLSGGLAVLSGIVYALLGKEPYFKRPAAKIKSALKEILINSAKGLKFSVTHETILLLLLSSSLMFLGLSVVSIGWQQYMKQELGIHEMYFGFVGAFLSLASIGALFYADRFVKKIKQEKYGLALIGLVVGLSVFLQSMTDSVIVGLAAFGTLFVMFDFGQPIFQNYFNRFVSSKNRATVISVKNMFVSAASILGSVFLYGWVTELFGIRTSYAVASIIVIISALIYLAINHKK